MDTIKLLLEIAEHSGFYKKKELTTIHLSKKYQVSQQTISNQLRRLEKQELIFRSPSYSGTVVGLTAAGRGLLSEFKERIEKLTERSDTLVGKAFTGLGEGRFYTEKMPYKSQFVKKLGIKPYPGTLNLKVDPDEKMKFLQDATPIRVVGFKNENRTYGAISCHNIYITDMKDITDMKAALIIPERSHYSDDTVEVISAENLRYKLNLKDGNEVELKWSIKQN
jgi:riboflavin kinase